MVTIDKQNPRDTPSWMFLISDMMFEFYFTKEVRLNKIYFFKCMLCDGNYITMSFYDVYVTDYHATLCQYTMWGLESNFSWQYICFEHILI